MNYLEIEFDIENFAQQDVLVALLAAEKFEGFQEENQKLKAFISENEWDEEGLKKILQIIPASYRQRILPPENWNAAWESSFDPLVINDQVAIRAAFHHSIASATYEIIVTPKMSFGTGHHATTYMMIEQMLQLDFINKKVFDFGTGTGVLAILAEKIGAAKIIAVDNDDWSIENSRENAVVNNCTRIVIRKEDGISLSENYDVILANINLPIILKYLPDIAAAITEKGVILLSGFLQNDETQLDAALKLNLLQKIAKFKRGEWLCYLCRK